FPEKPWEQLVQSINAVFGSWGNPRAIKYRKLNDIRGLIGTAVNVQSMVFGNMGDNSATGVAFTRDPATGADEFYGEYLINAQGEDVVAGIRTPEPIAKLEKVMGPIYQELVDVKNRLEQHYKDVQDIEFTIQDGKLYLLQTRSGKRTSAAAVKIASDMVQEGMIDKKTALLRLNPSQIDQFLHPTFDPKAERQVIGKGLAASPGAATGKVYFHAEDAEIAGQRGEKVILVRRETSPEDIGGMHASKGILTAHGGSTSHAAVVARGMGKCCVAGCDALNIEDGAKKATLGGATIHEGDYISLDGSTGEVMLGQVPTVEPELPDDLLTMLSWADDVRRLKVRANADTPEDATRAREFGAQGIGLCRTEHMFFDEDRIKAVREMILSDTTEAREKALAKLLPEQRKDFEGIFEAMDGLPVTIRLLDPPLHEFLPFEDKNQAEMAKVMGVDVQVVKDKVSQLHETNPMLGHRGCRLGVTHPEIYDMQVRAILEAAKTVAKSGKKVIAEIMIPLVGTEKELSFLRKRAENLHQEIAPDLDVLIGTMIEVPRAALTADEVAKHADFFSFGTNDLTQMALGLSRDDTGLLLEHYVNHELYERDPFVSIDVDGVGQLVRMACEKGRKTKPDLKLGICGEHGGDPASIAFCEEVGLDYVSCSPFRVPIARLAAAQAVLKKG
ncbi:MAG: pyruvate, phosphate dikinase, partial [Planctomycetota bacterium]